MPLSESELQANLPELHGRAQRLMRAINKCFDPSGQYRVSPSSAGRLSFLLNEFSKDVDQHYTDALPFRSVVDDYSRLSDFAERKILSKASGLREHATSQTTPANHASEIKSEHLEEYRRQSMTSLMMTFYTGDIDSKNAKYSAYSQAFREKIQGLELVFVNHGSTIGISEAESRQLWEQFSVLANDMKNLCDYKIMHASTGNLEELTAKHGEILKTSPNSLNVNSSFNKNPLVNSADIDPGTQRSDNMGIIQSICYASFQEMLKPLEKTSTSGGLTTSAFSRNNGFLSNTVAELVDMVCDRNDIVLYEGTVVTTNLASELAKFPPEAIDTIKFIAKCKMARDDLGSKAGIWHLGKNRGSIKYSDGSKGYPQGALASIFYQIGKNNTRNRMAGLLGFIDPFQTEFARDTNTANNNVRLTAMWIDKYKAYRYSHESQFATAGKYVPDCWYKDFPALDEFFNQTDGAVPGAQYEFARDKLLKVLELAADSIIPGKIILPDDPIKIGTTVANLVGEFASAAAGVWSYVGNPGNKPEYDYVHELMVSAFKYYITNIFSAIPTDMRIRDNLFGIMSPATRKYSELYDIVVASMVRQISLKGYYINDLIPHVKSSSHKARGIYLETAGYGLQQWVAENWPAYVESMTKGLSSTFRKNAFIKQKPECPIEDKGWGSSLQKDEGK